jgi:hypothetical protein
MNIFQWDKSTHTLTINIPFKIRITCEGWLVESKGIVGHNSGAGISFANCPMENGVPVLYTPVYLNGKIYSWQRVFIPEHLAVSSDDNLIPNTKTPPAIPLTCSGCE